MSSYFTGDDPDSISTIEYTYQHLKVIERFPHRNQILTRVSTAYKLYILK
ncbi:DUF924 family protein [cyanobacterium endosymbiont of Epithemia turgida]|nr:DUF924 family protein [cyanobacterium endosymbiont of Epithemia turgida]